MLLIGENGHHYFSDVGYSGGIRAVLEIRGEHICDVRDSGSGFGMMLKIRFEDSTDLGDLGFELLLKLQC